MKRGRKLLVIICILSILAGILSQEGFLVKAKADRVSFRGEIEVVFNRSETEMQKYIHAFEEKYPGVKVRYTSYNDLESELKVRAENGTMPDVTYFPSFIPSEEATEYFEPLGTYDELSKKYNFLEQGRYYEDLVYGIPSSAYFVGVIYNKEVFDEAGITSVPQTMDEFLYAMYLIDEYTDALPFYLGYSEDWILGYWEMFPYIEMTGKASYKYDEFIRDVNPFREGTVHNQTMRFLYNLVKDGYTEVDKAPMTWWDSVVGLNAGTVGCTIIGTWAFHEYKNVGPKGDNIAFMPFPNNINGQQNVTVSCDYAYAVSKNSDNKELAKAFVEFMLDESGYALNRNTISVLKTDLYPEAYGDLTKTEIKSSANATAQEYALYHALNSNLNISDVSEYQRIVKSAAGTSDESFEDIMNDWNERWESGRTQELVDALPESGKETDNTIVVEREKVEFSQGEKTFISDNPTLRVGYHTLSAPLSFEEQGEFQGISRYIMDFVSKETGIEMIYKGYSGTDELIEALKNGEIDFVAGIEKTDVWTDIRYSKEYMEYMDVMIKHDMLDVASVKKYAGVTGEKYAVSDFAKETIACKNFEAAIKKVKHRESDYTLMNYYSANYYIRKNDYENITIIPYTYHQTYHVGFGEKTNPVLIAIVNKCIYSINSGETDIILMQYMDDVAQNITITSFVHSNPHIAIGIVSLLFLLMFIILYERYRAKDKEAMDAKRYAQLAALADESVFDYDYKKEKFKFNSAINTDGPNNILFMQFYEQMKDVIAQKKDTQVTIHISDRENHKQWYRVITSVVYDKKKQPVNMIGKIINIQKEMQEVENYQNIAYRDPLTHLYNREGFFAHIPKQPEQVMFAVMDLDNFKQINDTLGHEGGDIALKLFADSLMQCVGAGNKATIARYGGDEFIAMLVNVTEEEAKEKFEKLVAVMDRTMEYKEKSCRLSISVGAVYTESMDSYEELFNEADNVLYETKRMGKNSFRFIVK